MSFESFVDNYYLKFAEVIRDFDKTSMPAVLEILTRASAAGGTVWVAGSGGSAAISDHTVCNVTKGRPRGRFGAGAQVDIPTQCLHDA